MGLKDPLTKLLQVCYASNPMDRNSKHAGMACFLLLNNAGLQLMQPFSLNTPPGEIYGFKYIHPSFNQRIRIKKP